MKKLFVSALLIVLGAHQAQASSISSMSAAFALFHFGGEYAGKKVKSVAVHTGIETAIYPTNGGTQEVRIVWADVRDESLPRVGDHFFKKLELRGSSGAYETGSESVLGLAVQYRIEFEDGTEAKATETFRYPRTVFSSSEFGPGPEYFGLKRQFDERVDATGTVVVWYTTQPHG
jgi:hypothetical protein